MTPWSGRVIVPSYWAIKTRDGLQLAMANFNARGVVGSNGDEIFSGPKHLKATNRGSSGKSLMPVGFCILEPDNFLQRIKAERRIILCEGIITAASLGGLAPNLRGITIALNGKGFNQLIALLNWLRKQGIVIDTLVGAYDFDLPGAKAYEDHKRLLETLVEGVRVIPPHDLLHPEI